MKETMRWLTLTGQFKFTRSFLVVAFNYPYILIVLLYVQTSAPVQMVNGELFEREDLGSIPGLNIFLFSTLFVADPVHVVF